MGSNIAKGNMYDWVTHTWNTIKGACPHDCSYCYMKRWGNLKPMRFDQREMKADLGTGNLIFVGSSCDMFAEAVPREWIWMTIAHSMTYGHNRYLFQSKNPARIMSFSDGIETLHGPAVCTTIETNRWYPDVMRYSPRPDDRAAGMARMPMFERYVTIEPIMDFDLEPMVELIKRCDPVQVNIGADSGRNGLPEPTLDKIMALVDELSKFTTIAKKRNLDRLKRV